MNLRYLRALTPLFELLLLFLLVVKRSGNCQNILLSKIALCE